MQCLQPSQLDAHTIQFHLLVSGFFLWISEGLRHAPIIAAPAFFSCEYHSLSLGSRFKGAKQLLADIWSLRRFWIKMIVDVSLISDRHSKKCRRFLVTGPSHPSFLHMPDSGTLSPHDGIAYILTPPSIIYLQSRRFLNDSPMIFTRLSICLSRPQAYSKIWYFYACSLYFYYINSPASAIFITFWFKEA